MKVHTHTVSASASLPASADRVYAILADYRRGHPRILPPQFRGLTVARGGVGEGTIVRFQMRIFGKTRTYRAAISEPAPGRVLVETGLDSNGASTTFTVDPNPVSSGSRVEISTSLQVRNGVLGWIERSLTTRVLRRIYLRELQILAEVAAQSTEV